MLKLRIHSTRNEQKPFNGSLQESIPHWVTCYLLFLASFFFLINKEKKKDTGIVVEQMHTALIHRTNSTEKDNIYILAEFLDLVHIQP